MSHPPTPTGILRRGLTAPGPPTRLAALDAASLSLRALNLWPLLLLLLVIAGCGYDKADRWDIPQGLSSPPLCSVGDVRCGVGQLQRCEKTDSGLQWMALDDCASHDEVCVPSLLECKACQPNEASCDGQTIIRCDATGNKKTTEGTCSGDGIACREGSCVDLCAQAKVQRSNVGCEYWAVDLDNADINDSLNAAAQQFAVVVSNPQPDVSAKVGIDQDDTDPGQPGAPVSVATTTIPPLGLRVFKLGPREVDGSPPGEFNTGTNTALTRHAYRISSSVPVVAYQFNPLANVNVFSNDASLLKPVEALSDLPGEMTDAYVVLGWPQTIAATQNPDTNFNPADPINLRVFLTIVGTRPDTHVKIKPRAEIVPGGPVPDTKPGGEVDMTLNPFDVLNLETGAFNADFTGSLVQSDQPVVVFSGSEASDAPFFTKLAFRQCCADHLEEQLDPVRTSGRKFVASLSENRTQAVAQAGATLGIVAQPEYFRIIATTDAGAKVKTTLGGKLANIALAKKGSFVNIATQRNFMFESDQPVQLGDVMPSQDAAGVPRGLPGGDPSFLIVPPIEQYRRNYVFLTPDKYSFDFIRIIAPPGTDIVLDGQRLRNVPGCTSAPADGLDAKTRGSAIPPYTVFTCQLSFPVVDPLKQAPDNLAPGKQNDGVHRIDANRNVGVLVDGFDSYVSYAYAAGTQLTEIVPR